MRTMLLLLFTVVVGACEYEREPATAGGDDHDSAFATLQDRGAAPEGMGVDQYASAHSFDDLPSGGRIELQDTAGDDAAAPASTWWPSAQVQCWRP